MGATFMEPGKPPLTWAFPRGARGTRTLGLFHAMHLHICDKWHVVSLYFSRHLGPFPQVISPFGVPVVPVGWKVDIAGIYT